MPRAGSPHRAFGVLVAVFTLLALSGISPPTAQADAGYMSPVRNCNGTQSCRVQSQAYGDILHQRCSSSGTGCYTISAWYGGSTAWRTSWHGSGSQKAFIYASGDINSQSTACICTSNCPQ